MHTESGRFRQKWALNLQISLWISSIKKLSCGLRWNTKPSCNKIKSLEESETENADLNYEEIMTGSNSANKMPDPRESIFATHYSRTDKSCPSPTVRPLARIVKRATYYNNSCYLGPSKPEEPYRVQVYKHIINYDNQCYTSLGALDQEETFAAQTM